MTAVLNAVKRVHTMHPQKQILLLGHSFGCRVLLEFIQAHGNELPDWNVLDAVVCQGYPLFKSGVPETDPNNVKRAAHLRNLGSTTKTLIVQGEQDSFLGPRGMASLQDLVESLEDTHNVSLVQFRNVDMMFRQRQYHKYVKLYTTLPWDYSTRRKRVMMVRNDDGSLLRMSRNYFT